MKNIRQYFAFIIGLSIACVAAFFSITGLSKLFAGATGAIILMGIVLEAGKIVAASYVQKNSKDIGRIKTIGLSIMVVILMFITSMGIYGFLTDAYQKTAHKFENVEKQTEIIDKKEILVKNQIKRNEDLILSRSEREKSLTTLRTTQENRIDNLLSSNKNNSAKTTQAGIADANSEIKQINLDIDGYNKQISILNDSVNNFENQKFQLSNSNSVAEIGPLKYIANLTGKPMDIVVNWLILMLIFVFDPLAMLLLISAQSIDKKDDKIETLKAEPEIKEPDVEESKIISENLSETKPMKAPNEDGLKNYFDNEETESFSPEPDVEEKTEHEKKIEDFEKHYEKKLESIEKYRTKFDELLDVLYNDGSVQVGENLLNYLEFKDRVEKTFVKKFTPDDIRKFLTICNLLEITSLSAGKREALLSFKDAKEKLQNYFQK